MQREIKKRAGLYGVVAVLLALMLGSIFYSIGVIPQIQLSQPSVFRAFASAEDIKTFLTANSETYTPFPFVGPIDISVGPVRTWLQTMPMPLPASEVFVATAPGLSTELAYLAMSQEVTYSQTNIQVSNVDEADIVKTDGEYLYVMSGNSIYILKAYPSDEAEVLSEITFNDTSLVGIFLSRASNRLAVLGSKYKFPEYYYGYSTGNVIIDVKTFLNVYDITNKSAPSLLTNFTMTGSYFSSRMIGDYVYFVVSQPAYIVYETVVLPKVITKDGMKEISASEVLYSETSDDYFIYTTIAAVNIATAEEPTYKTIMLGGTSNMYVSPNNIYITFQASDETTIYRIRVENSTISPEAKGTVRGRELNQFSMDEYNSHFRIATSSWVNWTEQNNLYVLNMNLSVIGELENLAVGENLHSARFVGDRCYLVTFKKTDPLFVIDLSNPTTPAVLGQLKIPGYSDYLHPYDENHLIGVGKETVEADEEYFAWYQGVKISLFDVSNVSNPIQIANYTIGDRGTDSPVLTDHKAFLFDKSKNLLVIPVLVAEIDESQYPEGVPPYAYGTPVWQGAYVFNITLTDGFVLRGKVTHGEDSIGVAESSYWVKRALYIDNVLYTISDREVKLNSLEDLAFIKEIELN
jgi:inhibitor of cysteine peptidase